MNYEQHSPSQCLTSLEIIKTLRKHLNSANNKNLIVKESTDNSIINNPVKYAVKNLITEPTLSALFNIQYFNHMVQGTSPVKAVNSAFQRAKPINASRMIYNVANLFVNTVIYQYNLKYNIKYFILNF